MKKRDEDPYSQMESKLEYYSIKPEELDSYLKDATDVDIIAYYKYVIRKLEQLRGGKDENLRFYWQASNKLRKTSAVSRYLTGEISDLEVERYIATKNAQIEEILKALYTRKHKSPGARVLSYLKG